MPRRQRIRREGCCGRSCTRGGDTDRPNACHTRPQGPLTGQNRLTYGLALKAGCRPLPAVSPVHGPIAHAAPCKLYRSPRVISPAIHHRTRKWDLARDVASEASIVRHPKTPHRVAHQDASVFVGHETTGGSASRACRTDQSMDTPITETSLPPVAVGARLSLRFGGVPRPSYSDPAPQRETST